VRTKSDIASEHFAAFAEYMGYARIPGANSHLIALGIERDDVQKELEETKALLDEARKDCDFFDAERQKVVARLESSLLEIERMKSLSTERDQLHTALIEQLKKERDSSKNEAELWKESTLRVQSDLHAVAVAIGVGTDCRIAGSGQDAAIVQRIVAERDELRAEVHTLRACYTDSSYAVRRLSIELEKIKSFFKQFEEK